MAYDDIDTAWTDFLEWWTVDYSSNVDSCGVFLTTAFGAGFTAAGFNALRQAVESLMFANIAMFGNGISYILDMPLGGVLYHGCKLGPTLAQINASMLNGDYLEISEYLSIQWAFQQSMWDQPFFADKYAAIINRIRT